MRADSQIGCRKPQLPATMISMNHPASKAEIPAKILIGFFQIPGFYKTADSGTAYHTAIQLYRLAHLCLKAIFLPHAHQHTRIALGLGAKGKIRACYQIMRIQAVAKFINKSLWTLTAQLFIKGHIHQHLYSHSFQNICLGNIISNLHRHLIRSNLLQGVVAKGINHADQLVSLGQIHSPLNNTLVADMNSVKGSQSHRCSFIA